MMKKNALSLLSVAIALSVGAALPIASAQQARPQYGPPAPSPAPGPDEIQNPTRACPHPNPNTQNWVGLNFTMTGWMPEDLKDCKEKVRLAKEMGFTGITLAPRFNFDPATGGVTALKNGPEMIGACLKEIWDAGMDLNYKPHLEDEKCWIEKQNKLNACWRAWLNVYPQMDYPKSAPHRTMYEPFLKWAENHKKEIQKTQGNQKLKLVLATELEKSLTWHPEEWANTIRDLKQELGKKAGLNSTNVQVGINPNWFPYCTMNSKNCDKLAKLVATTDFINPSIYGDRSEDAEHKLSKDALASRREKLIDLQLKRGNCKFSGAQSEQLKSAVRRKIGVGEIGIGSSFEASEDWDGSIAAFEKEIKKGSYASIDDYKNKRQRVLENLLSLTKLSANPNKSLSFWSSGIHDFTGISNRQQTLEGIATENTIPQANMIAMLQKYSETRCGVKYSKSPDTLIAEARKLTRTDKVIALETLVKNRTAADVAKNNSSCDTQENQFQKLFKEGSRQWSKVVEKIKGKAGPYAGMAIYCTDDIKKQLGPAKKSQ